jgi:hypothetical protein
MIRSLYVADCKGKNHLRKGSLIFVQWHSHTNTEFDTIDTIDSIRSLYVTSRKEKNYFEKKYIAHIMFNGTRTQTLNFPRLTRLI